MRMGNVYQIANGYMGYRGTLDEFGPEELEHMTEFYKAIGFSSIVTAFSSGIELDIIQPLVIDTWDAYKEDNNG